MKIHILFVGLILLCFSCKNQPSGSNAAGAPIPLKYAENLVLFPIEDYTIAQLRNPWDTTKILHTYILVPKEKKVPTHLPEGTVVKIPLSKAIVYSFRPLQPASAIGFNNKYRRRLRSPVYQNTGNTRRMFLR